LQCFPDIGQALVMRIGGTAGGRDVYKANLPYSDGITGVSVYNALSEGVCVDCVAVKNGSLTECNITGVSKYWKDRNRGSWNGKQTAVALPEIAARLARAFIGDKTGLILPHSAGVPQKILPGDVLMRDKKSGVGLDVRRQAAGLCGPNIARLDVTADDYVRAMGAQVSLETPMSESVDEGDVAVENHAQAIGEAFGVLNGYPPMRVVGSGDDRKLEPVNQDAIPLYRLQRMCGSLVGGDDKLVFGMPQAEIHDASFEPEVLAKTRTSTTGALSSAGSERVCSIKTPDIPAMTQLGYRRQSAVPGHDGKFVELREPFVPGEPPVLEFPLDKYFDNLSEEERVRDSALYLFARRILNKGYTDAGYVPEKGLGYHESTQPDSAATEQTTSPTSAPTLPLPKIIPIPGAKPKDERHYDSTSFITQEPDGSICLCDGYGSEIRMSRGNIYISPALDLYIRPGRDMSVMAGRHQSYNSQGSLTLNTSDSMFTRSAHRMEFCAGTAKDTGNEGIVMESRNVSGDVVLRSAHNLSMTGAANVLLGRRQTPNTTGGQQAAFGMVSVDAGDGGSGYINGGAGMTVEAGALDICALSETAEGETTGTAIRLTRTSVDILAKAVHIPAQVLLTSPPDGVNLLVPRAGEEVKVTAATATPGRETIVVGGQMIVHGTTKIQSDTLICGRAIANGMISTSRFNAQLSPKVLDPNTDLYVFKKTEPPDVSYLSDRALVAANVIEELQKAPNILSADYCMQHEFRFPASYGVQKDIVFPGMVWQEHTDGAYWSEDGVPSSDGQLTMCYPGATVWKEAKVSAVYGTKPFNVNGYRINALKTEV